MNIKKITAPIIVTLIAGLLTAVGTAPAEAACPTKYLTASRRIITSYPNLAFDLYGEIEYTHCSRKDWFKQGTYRIQRIGEDDTNTFCDAAQGYRFNWGDFKNWNPKTVQFNCDQVISGGHTYWSFLYPPEGTGVSHNASNRSAKLYTTGIQDGPDYHWNSKLKTLQ